MQNSTYLIALWLCIVVSTKNSFATNFNDDEEEEEGTGQYFLHVVNNSPYEIEPIVRWVSGYLNIRNVTICVCPQPRYFKESGFVVKTNGIYFIYLKDKLVNPDLIVVHELIHVKQYERGDLVRETNNSVRYKGKRIILTRTDYENRLYEIEAHATDSKILREYYRYKKALNDPEGWICAEVSS